MIYTLHRELTVQASPEKAWDFIKNPANLNLITPPEMHFNICSELPDEMEEGMLVEYRVKIPGMGTTAWLSELKQIQPGKSFVDVQCIGPYRFWHHFHGLKPTDNGVLLTDHVTYCLPYGPAGRIAHALFVRRTLERIFDYREERFEELLSKESPSI